MYEAPSLLDLSRYWMDSSHLSRELDLVGYSTKSFEAAAMP